MKTYSETSSQSLFILVTPIEDCVFVNICNKKHLPGFTAAHVYGNTLKFEERETFIIEVPKKNAFNTLISELGISRNTFLTSNIFRKDACEQLLEYANVNGDLLIDTHSTCMVYNETCKPFVINIWVDKDDHYHLSKINKHNAGIFHKYWFTNQFRHVTTYKSDIDHEFTKPMYYAAFNRDTSSAGDAICYRIPVDAVEQIIEFNKK